MRILFLGTCLFLLRPECAGMTSNRIPVDFELLLLALTEQTAYTYVTQQNL